MSDVHNHEHAKENKGVGPASSLRTVIGVIVSIIAVCLVMFAIFRVYSNELSDELPILQSRSWSRALRAIATSETRKRFGICTQARRWCPTCASRTA